MEDNNYLLEKKIEYLVNMKLNKMQTALTDALGRIQSMNEDIELLKNKVNRLNMNTNSNPQTRLVSDEKPQNSGEKEVKKEVSGNGRTGGYRPEDVSVDKMFYFGNKR